MSGEEIRKAKKEETGQKKEQIETDNNMEPARPVTETKQEQPFDTSLKHMKEKRWEMLMSTDIRGERDGTIWLGEGENETVVIYSRRTTIILRGKALRAWKAMDQKREHKERTTAVTVGEMRVTAVHQPVWNVVELL